MPYLAIYDNLEAIPESIRSLYKQQADGKWHFNGAEFQGLAELLNPALENHKNQILKEKNDQEAIARAANARATAAEAELVKYKAPGSVVLGQDDAKAWARYTALGDVKTVEGKVKDHADLSVKVARQEQEAELRTAAEKGGLNFDVLKDRISQDANGIKVVVKEVKTKDAAGKEVSSNQVFIKRTVPGETQGSVKELEEDLFAYAGANWPKYAVDSLRMQQQTQAQQQQQPASFRIPVTTQTTSTTAQPGNSGLDPVKVAEQRNAARNAGAKTNPFAPAPKPQQQQQ